jgi:hypothetical protein
MHLLGLILGVICIPLYTELNSLFAKNISKHSSLLTRLEWWFFCNVGGYVLVLMVILFFNSTNLLYSLGKLILITLVLLITGKLLVSLNVLFLHKKNTFLRIIIASLTGLIASILFFVSIAISLSELTLFKPQEEFLLGGIIISLLFLPITTLYGLHVQKIIQTLKD